MNVMASYYKCALQVNSASYAKYRGDQPDAEENYNKEIVEHCIGNSISVVGLADHGDVDSSESLRRALSDNGIVVFPGFEISTTEKIHIVCLFPSEYDSSRLNRILGGLGLSSLEKGTEVSSQTCKEIAKTIEENNGFWYAAHITGDNGILKLGKNQHIWKDPCLRAAQIPASRDEIDPAYKNIINNTDPVYRREIPIAYINAADIEKPEDLDKESASVLIKMSKPNFANFCDAFKDPESRIRLNSEKEQNYQSCIKHLKIIGGYLDGLDIDFSGNLLTVIGGRGTGKSTLIELIRYALGKEPLDTSSISDFRQMVDTNLGDGGRVELTVISNAQHGQEFNIVRRYKQDPVIKDRNGEVSLLSVRDILPSIEIYGQNEIIEIAKDPQKIRDVADRLFTVSEDVQNALNGALEKIAENSRALDSAENKNNQGNALLEELPSIQTKLEFYKEAGFDEKLQVLKKLSSEEGIIKAIKSSFPQEESFEKICLTDANGSCDEINEIINAVSDYNKTIEGLNDKRDKAYQSLNEKYEASYKRWKLGREKYDEQLRESIKSIDGLQGKSSNELATEYADLIKKQEQCKPLAESKASREKNIKELLKTRKTLIEKYKNACDQYDDCIRGQLKKINKKKLQGKVCLKINFRQNKTPVLERLQKIPGVGEKSIKGIKEYTDFDIFTFTDDVRQGSECLRRKYDITQGTAEKICDNLSDSELRKLENLRLKDIVGISLLVGDKYKELKDLSKGQQCTAILNLLLIDNKDPLIVDQPEDNLDNSFIAENLVKTLRTNKIKRQYMFATHNANIPVFGDAEQIITMEEQDGHGRIAEGGIGSIDEQEVKLHVISILEGGKSAFKMREEKYGL